MNPKTRTALEGSIAKWQAIVDGSGIASAQAVANAHLIAAAPDLYEALVMARAYVATVGSHYVKGTGGFDRDLAQIDAALAKEEGRMP